MAGKVVERGLKASELRKGMTVRRWPGVKRIDREIVDLEWRGKILWVWLQGRKTPVTMSFHTPVVIREGQ